MLVVGKSLGDKNNDVIARAALSCRRGCEREFPGLSALRDLSGFAVVID
jgi:hypothetical protein